MDYHVLIVEDQKIAQLAMQMTLRNYACTLDTVISGKRL